MPLGKRCQRDCICLIRGTNLTWDQQLSDNELDECKLGLAEAGHLQDISAPRYFTGAGSHEMARRELHIFYDASKNAFAAVAYIRTVTTDLL